MSAVLTVVFLLLSSLTSLAYPTGYRDSQSVVFGGPDLGAESPIIAQENQATLVARTALSLPEEDGFVPIIDGDSLLGEFSPGDAAPLREGLLVYRIKKGDVISRIAANFGISVNTILWANDSIKVSALPVGVEIVILPVSGVLHRVSEGENLASLARIYGIPEQRIQDFNPRATQGGVLVAGQMLVIPGGSPREYNAELVSYKNLPNLDSYFGLPAAGTNWGKLHHYNAVDIADVCGTPVYAAAEGLAAEVFSAESWNNGYGGAVLMKHPNGTETRYAHLQSVAVSGGDYVSKGERIGEMGNTGNVVALGKNGNGCHLHFEVINAHNFLGY